jgi:hypothetical protein
VRKQRGAAKIGGRQLEFFGQGARGIQSAFACHLDVEIHQRQRLREIASGKRQAQRGDQREGDPEDRFAGKSRNGV